MTADGFRGIQAREPDPSQASSRFYQVTHLADHTFSHPDCTVGLGISPGPALARISPWLAGFTAGRELHPAPKVVILNNENYLLNISQIPVVGFIKWDYNALLFRGQFPSSPPRLPVKKGTSIGTRRW